MEEIYLFSEERSRVAMRYDMSKMNTMMMRTVMSMNFRYL